ncbi:MAG TPA: sugar phosphate isomerase/epimerase [Candidatus Acidoferrum sp.]|nr:sugar phosphate isomerase/epimerase [Candidatus Acidoferrum sp.]
MSEMVASDGDTRGHHGREGGIHLNGATIMTTPTATHLEIARAVGYAGVEVRAERLLDAPSELEDAVREAHVEPGEVWSLNGIQLQLGPDGRLDRRRLDREMPPRLAICRRLVTQYLLVVPPRADGADRTLAIQAMRDGLEILRDAASRDDVGVAFEFLGFADCPIDSPALAGEVVAGLDGVDLVLDSCHWHASGSGSLDPFPVERLAMVHLNDAPQKPPREIEDADRLLPGRGVIRLAELIAGLRSRGYAGPWSLETFNHSYWSEPPERVAADGLAAVQAVLAETATS